MKSGKSTCLAVPQPVRRFHSRVALQQVITEPILIHGFVLPQMQHFSLALSEFIRFILVQLSSLSRSCWMAAQFGVISKFAEGTLYPFDQIIDECVE